MLYDFNFCAHLKDYFIFHGDHYMWRYCDADSKPHTVIPY